MQKTRDSIAHVWGERTPYHGEYQWPTRLDERVEEQPDRWVQSVCVLCSNGCGMDVGVKDGRIVGVRGRVEDRVNRGRLGPKGMHGWVANHAPDRLTKPLIRVGKKSPEHGVDFSAQFREASWDEAMELVARRSRETIDRYTGDAIGIYNSGQLFIEEYYTLGVVANAGIRTRQIDANVRLCTATTGAARWESFGAAVIPGSYVDVDVTDCIFLVGHNVANTQTVLWMRMLDRMAGPNPPRLVVVDPRDTHTALQATVHLAPRLGTNVAVMNGLLHLIIEAGQIDEAFIARHTVGYEELARRVRSYTPERVEEITGIRQSKLREAAEILGTTPTLISTCLWIAGTNPAVSLPGLYRIRNILAREDLFVVVSDAFMTETAQLADVVLPAAIWGERTGTLTNADRTVHLSLKAIDPPGEARSDLETGAAISKEEYEALNPAGRAIIKSADYHPPIESPDETYPYWLTTYRSVYHFQTRTKTGRSRELHEAAPDAVVQIHPTDAAQLGIAEGDLVEVRTRRGTVRVPAHLQKVTSATEQEAGPGLMGRAGAVAGQAVHVAKEVVERVSTLLAPERSYVADYLGIVRSANEQFVAGCEVMIGHVKNASRPHGSVEKPDWYGFPDIAGDGLPVWHEAHRPNRETPAEPLLENHPEWAGPAAFLFEPHTGMAKMDFCRSDEFGFTSTPRSSRSIASWRSWRSTSCPSPSSTT
jgi:anaerobic selenocysteine-containing dehydrogenase